MHHCVSSVLHIYHLRLSVKPKALPVRCPCGLYSGVPAKTSYEKPGEISPPHAHDSTGKGSACPHPCRRSVYGTCIDTGVCGAVQCRDIGRNFALHVPAAFSHERIFPVKPPHRVPVPYADHIHAVQSVAAGRPRLRQRRRLPHRCRPIRLRLCSRFLSSPC